MFTTPGAGQRCLLGGLEQAGVAAGQRRGQLPRGQHQRVVPRDDQANDAERLAHGVVEVGAGRDRDRLALQLGRPARKVPEVVDRHRQVVVTRQPQRLAHVQHLELGQRVGVTFKQLCDAPQELAALGRSDLLPVALGRRGRRGHGPVDVLAVGRGAAHQRLAGRRVQRLERGAVRGVGPVSADEQLGGPGGQKRVDTGVK
jgi:hypothetical protein